jgi:ABC-type multidrug transport system ATPase subunit
MKIKVKNLEKVYKNGKQALNNIDLEINNGLFGLLGPNGAGKTTFMRILATLMKPTTGEVTIDDYDLQNNRREIRKMLGYLPQEFSSFPKIRTWEFLDYNARLAGITNYNERMDIVDKLLESVGLFDVKDRFAKKLSGGMKRRLGIAQALIGTPKILIVDEPTTGLDPEERIRFRNILSDMGQEDRIIILSTHIVGDISSTCQDMVLLNEGGLGFQGSPEDLIKTAEGHTFELNVTDSELEVVKEQCTVISTIPSENGWQVQVVSESMVNKSAKSITPNLEHAYVYFMEQQN